MLSGEAAAAESTSGGGKAAADDEIGDKSGGGGGAETDKQMRAAVDGTESWKRIDTVAIQSGGIKIVMDSLLFIFGYPPSSDERLG